MKSDQFTDQEYLKTRQYQNASNINARIYLHTHYSTHPGGLMPWVFSHLRLPPQSKILDIGCGPGDLWRENRERIPAGWQITLADLSEGMLAQVKENLAGVPQAAEFRVADAQELPFPAESFDAVIANHMLYHVPNISKALAEFQRVLKPGGELFASTNGANHLLELHQLLQQVDPAYSPAKAASLFGLENGVEILSTVFINVQCYRFEDNLVITEAQPLLDYIASMHFGLAGNPLDKLEAIIRQEIELQGAFRISKEPGLFKARKKKGGIMEFPQEILELENRDKGRFGEHTLYEAYELLKEYWENGNNDREIGLHLAFITWELIVEQWSSVGYFGIQYDIEEKIEEFLSIRDHFNILNSGDAELYYSFGLMLSLFPNYFGNEDDILELAKRYQDKYMEILPEGIQPEIFINRGLYGEYFEHHARNHKFLDKIRDS